MLPSIFIDGVNRDNYLISCGRIPHIKRDKILQPLGGSFDLVVSQNFTPAFDEQVLIKIDGNIRFSGFINKVSPSYNDSNYGIEVNSSLLKLKKYKIDYDTLHSTISSGGSANQYKSSDNEGFPNVAVLWLLQKMFTIAGLTLDISAVENNLVESGGVYGTVQEKNLVVDENMLYAINQNTAINYRIVDSTPTSGNSTFADRKISFWQFFQRYCIGRQLYVQPTTTADQFKLTQRVSYSSSNNYSISDDAKVGYEKTEYNSGATSDNSYDLKYSSDAVGGAVSTIRGLYAGKTFLPGDVGIGGNTIASADHRLKTGSVIRFSSTEALPSPLSSSGTYFVVNPNDNDFQVSYSKDGSAITFTAIGSGTHTYYGEYELKTMERQGFGSFNVPNYNNFWVKYHQSGTSVGSVQSNQRLTTSLMMGGYQNYYHIDPLPVEEIESRDPDFSKSRMLEHWIIVKDRRSKIIQPTI